MDEDNGDSIAEMELSALRSIQNTVTLAAGQTIEVWGGWSTSTDRRVLKGFVKTFKPEGGIIRIIAATEAWNLVRRNVNKIYDSSIDASAGEVSEIAEDLIETYGGLTADVQASGVLDGSRIDIFKCIHTDIHERLKKLKEALGWQMFYDNINATVHFEPPGFTDSGITLTVGSEIVKIPEWDYNTDNMINDLRIDGATTETDITETGQIGVTAGYTTSSILLDKTPNSAELLIDAGDPPTTQVEGGTKDSTTGNFYYIDRENKKIIPAVGTTFTNNHYAIINYVWSAPAPIHMTNSESIAINGLFEKELSFTDIASVADAESRGANILAIRSIPFVSSDIEVKSKAVNIPNIGEMISVVDNVNVPNINAQFVVNKLKLKYPSAVIEMEIGDKSWRMADWQEDQESRIKRLEEQFIRNQDIILELINIDNLNVTDNNAKKPTPRYLKITSQDIRDGGGEYSFVLGHPSAGVLGTNKLGDRRQTTVTHYVRQNNNIYTEDFIDEDFKGEGTADWTDTGSVDFTSGEIALSSSIDFNNGVITTAKLTSTEESGSFDYELTADGGSNWESVTSGTTHNFTNQGTDLRFRITENSASVGEISKVKITNYH